MKSYLCLHRPPMPGSVPRGAVEVVSFDDKTRVNGKPCWGIVTYENPLPCEIVAQYELAEKDDEVMNKKDYPVFPEIVDAYRNGFISLVEAIIQVRDMYTRINPNYVWDSDIESYTARKLLRASKS